MDAVEKMVVHGRRVRAATGKVERDVPDASTQMVDSRKRLTFDDPDGVIT